MGGLAVRIRVGGDLPSLHMQGKSTSGALEDLMLPVNTTAALVISSVCRRRRRLKYSW